MNFIKDIGTNLYLGGFVLVGREDPILVTFPETELWPDKPNEPGLLSFHNEDGQGWLEAFKPTLEEYKAIIAQMDDMETEVIQMDGSKVILRKSQRALDNRITWQVFKRDEFKCRYCGNDDVPLTYDHVFLWEKGGDNTLENGVSACSKCNKQRGNMDYRDWLNSKIYQKKIEGVEAKFIKMNEDLLPVYQGFAQRVSAKSRK